MPARFYTGRGAYASEYDTRMNIAKWSARFGLIHRGLHDLGATWYAPPAQLMNAIRLASNITTMLRQYAFSPSSQWPRWTPGVASMYAQEMAVNHLYPEAVPLMEMDHNTNKATTNGELSLLFSSLFWDLLLFLSFFSFFVVVICLVGAWCHLLNNFLFAFVKKKKQKKKYCK